MKIKEIRAMSVEQLADEVIKLRREQFNLRMQSATGQGAKPDQQGAPRHRASEDGAAGAASRGNR